MLYTTLERIRQWSPCKDRLKVLLTALGDEGKDETKLIPLDFIIESNGVFDASWVLRATTEPCEREIRLLACQFAEGRDGGILALYERQYPGDSRVRDYITTARRYALGKASLRELQVASEASEAAAWAASEASEAAAWAAGAAAWAVGAVGATAGATAWAASEASEAAAWAAEAAAWAASEAAAWAASEASEAAAEAAEAAERQWQKEQFIKMLIGKGGNYV